MQEFLVVVAIALAIFYLPRLMGRKPVAEPVAKPLVLTGWIRLAILVTVVWIAGFTALLKPWQDDAALFAYAGLGPVAALWGAFWVWSGYKKYRREAPQ
jgi:hypothetical protein